MNTAKGAGLAIIEGARASSSAVFEPTRPARPVWWWAALLPRGEVTSGVASLSWVV